MPLLYICKAHEEIFEEGAMLLKDLGLLLIDAVSLTFDASSISNSNAVQGYSGSSVIEDYGKEGWGSLSSGSVAAII